jgi:hypothetical protein
MWIKSVYRLFVGKLDSKRPLVRPRRRWENNIKTYLQATERRVVDWIDLAQEGTSGGLP